MFTKSELKDLIIATLDDKNLTYVRSHHDGHIIELVQHPEPRVILEAYRPNSVRPSGICVGIYIGLELDLEYDYTGYEADDEEGRAAVREEPKLLSLLVTSRTT